MPPPQTTLSTLQVVTPVLPSGVIVVSVDSSVLPIVVNADLNTSRVEISLYGNLYASDVSTVVGNFNQFSFSIPLVLGVAETQVQMVGRNYDPTQSWSASTLFPVGYRVVDINGNVQIVTVSGVSGTSQPAWNTTIASTTVDGAITWTDLGATAITPPIRFQLLYSQSDLSVSIGPPTGISANRNQTACSIQWVTPTYAGFIGVRVMISTDSAGINPPYVQYGPLIATVNSSGTAIINSQSNTEITVPTAVISSVQLVNNLLTITAVNSFPVGTTVDFSGLVNATFLNGLSVTVVDSSPSNFVANFTGQNYSSTPDTGLATSTISTNTTTTTQLVMPVEYSAVSIPYSVINDQIFYALLSTVIQDPETNTIYESVQNGPLTCGFVNLQLASPADFLALQQKEDIAGRLIGQIIRQRPNLDLSPRSEIRDVLVDPVAIELASMSVREWFARVSTSISAISQVDCTTGTGVSDPFQSSPYKQKIAAAFGLSPTDTQTLINSQFDLLGAQAGLTRLTATASTVVLTFYTYQQPQASITIPAGAIVATVADANTPSLNFITQGQATLTTANLASFYNAATGYWAVSVPAQCTSTGSIGNVGAGSIRQTITGVPSGVNVVNLLGADFGTDLQSNSAFAAMIQARLVTGVDSGTRHGYLVTALGTPGVTSANVVAAGDVDMVRDWAYQLQRHVFGSVDIYVSGTTLSQQNDLIPFTYANVGQFDNPVTYLSITPPSPISASLPKFQIQGFSSLPYSPYAAIQLLVSRSQNNFYLGLQRAQFDNVNGYIILNPSDMAYQIVGNTVTEAQVPLLINGSAATNQVALASLAGAQSGTYTFQLFARLSSPLIDTPTLQPILEVYGVTGSATETGAVSSTSVELIQNSDFLMQGGSNEAGDTIEVPLQSFPQSTTITASTATPMTIASAMDVPVDFNGNPQNILSVLSTDSSTLYIFGIDYTIVPTGAYHTYGLQVLTSSVQVTGVSIVSNVLTINCINEFGVGAPITLNGLTNATFLNGQTVTIGTVSGTQFTATYTYTNYGPIAETGTATGSAIQNNQQVVVNYNQFQLYERLTFISQEPQVLSGSLPTALDNLGFVYNTWLPESYGNTTLTLDGWDGLYGSDGGLDLNGSSGLVGASVPHDSRYIKVTYNNGVTNVVMREGLDFTLTVESASGAASLARILTGRIPDGGTVSVSYFVTEVFTVSTQYPTFVQTLADEIAVTKHACADVLIKAMIENPVNITLTVILQPSALSSTIDPIIRTTVGLVLDNAEQTLYQSALIQQIQAINGVQSIQLPLTQCAKSDGSYDIGVVIPSTTTWVPLNSDPAFAGLSVPSNSFITAIPVLPDSTIPSGGTVNAVVSLLYQGQEFRRAMSVQDFLTNSPSVASLTTQNQPGSFYFIGMNDQISASTPLSEGYWQKVLITVPTSVPNPGNLSFLATYQVWGASSSQDIVISPLEYLSIGTLTINYLSP
jgi:Baseplate J-like protein